MQVTKITTPAEESIPAAHRLTEEQMYNEINYHRAEKMTQKMLDTSLIDAEEYGRILTECRKIFVPFLAELM